MFHVYITTSLAFVQIFDNICIYVSAADLVPYLLSLHLSLSNLTQLKNFPLAFE